jgi:hypothetical protein
MANSNAPFGFRPTMRSLHGAPGAIVGAHKLVGYATAFFMHDVVTHAASGTKSTLCVDKAITPGTTPVLGVNLNYGAASTATDHSIVLAASGALFVAQGDGTGATFLVAASLSKRANIALTAGDTNTKVSKHQISETSIATTNTLDLRIRGLFQSPDNAAGQYAKVYVTFNNLVDADQKAGI